MKKIVVLFLVLSLTLIVAGSASADEGYVFLPSGYSGIDFENPYLMKYSVENYLYGRFPSFEGWYSIEKEVPSATVRGTFQDGAKIYEFQAFQNDQTFAEFKYFDGEEINPTYFKGSYLFDFNLFIGLEYASRRDKSQFIVFPGYRFNLGDDNGYVSLSLDYALNNDILYKDNGIIDYEIKGRYYFDKAKLYGQVIYADDDIAGDENLYLRLGGAYQVSQNIVLGARFADMKDNHRIYEIGCTAAFDKFGAELSYINIKADDAEDIYQIHTNLLYSFTDKIRAGMELVKTEDYDTVMIAKAKYTLDDKKSIFFMHQIPTDGDDGNADAVTYLGLDYKF